ncbi:MAG: tetratricopeptide repeat protein [Kiritimatiellae bacterium]|jgi:predicted negative regulator of RcsB-dependent stress response|nr:tetratricopeptide repeat protein [Kiritimatiellia bacterium]
MTKKEHNVSANHDDLTELKKLVNANGKMIIGVVVVVAVLVFGYLYITYNAKKKNAEASELLSVASNVQDLETLVNDYSSTEAAPLADFALAKAYYEAGRFDEAMSIYSEFEKKFPESHMKTAANVGILFCKEGKGEYAEALTGFDKFISENAENYLIDQVTFAKARCLKQLGKTEEAKVVYETFISSNPDSPWVPNAEMLLEQL